MLKINRLKVEILSDKSASIDELYGFDYNFNDGLNVIAGPNSRGKTTINSCIYYSLGMEELLGNKNEKALDKALKEEFTILSDDGEVSHNISFSKVLLEIQNDKKRVATLLRYITPGNSEIKTSNISVYERSLDLIDGGNPEIFYVDGRGNNDNENGFYVWLADFMQLSIPQVSNNSRTDNYSPLYLQTIFATLLIEQTKGWSDFFATMPNFGIARAKEKNVEFLLGLNELHLSTQKDILNKEKSKLSDEWEGVVSSFSLIEKRYNGTFENIPREITAEKSKIDGIIIWFSIAESERITLDVNISNKANELVETENIPLSTVQDNRGVLLEDYNIQKREYFELKEYVKNFELKLELDEIQFSNLNKQLKSITQEIKDHQSLEKVFDENIINEKGGNYCPTCTQSVSTDLISNTNITIPKLSLSENINFLKSQKNLIVASIASLDSTIQEKKVLLTYFNNSLRQREILIKSISRDLIADDRAFSETQVLKRIQLEKELDDLKFLQQSIQELKNELITLANKYHNNLLNYKNLSNSEKDDELKLNNFEGLYKDMLFSFGYESNEKYRISINRNEPFKYFPVYKRFKDDSIPQSIRINSSASDFVRNIWAYSLTLLIQGENHPGLLLFDEPGQHRTNIQSLKALLALCSVLGDKQIIIFTSIDKALNEHETLDLDKLVEDLDLENYKLIRLDDKHKVIQKL